MSGGLKGYFITFEGGEGAGKSTQIKRLSRTLERENFRVLETREPGGSPGAEILRHVLLSGAAQPFGAKTEVMLFAAARLDHMRQTIIPALEQGKIVLCDRFYDSTRAYQGSENGVTDDLLFELEDVAVGDHKPDLTIILDVDPILGLARVEERLKKNKKDDDMEKGEPVAETIDRFEKDSLEVHQERRKRFLDIAYNDTDRCVVVDASQDQNVLADEIWEILKERYISKLGATEGEDSNPQEDTEQATNVE